MKLKLSGFNWSVVGLLMVFDERKSLSMLTLRNFRKLLRYFSLAYLIISLEMSTPTTSVVLWSFGRMTSTRTSPDPHPMSRSVKSDFSSKRCENSSMISCASRFCNELDFLYSFALFILKQFRTFNKTYCCLTESQMNFNWTSVPDSSVLNT